jgi:hypothetical protein
VTRSHTFMFALAVTLFICIVAYAAAWAGQMTAQLTPTKHEVVRVVKRVVKVERVIVPRPAKRTYPSLANPKDACTTAPVEIMALSVAGTKRDDKDTNTWLGVRPLGDDYIINCAMGGDYSFSFHVGDIVVVNGRLAGT